MRDATEPTTPRCDPEVVSALAADLAEARADLANVRRRRDQEIERARAAERGEGLARLADVADDLARAVALHPEVDSPWARGTAALLGRVRHQLRQAGGVPFGQRGDRFDPRIHEAVGVASGPPGAVVAVAREGLRLTDGTLVRPARVVVAQARPPVPETHR
jgi:molecular chaperone GrpE